MARSYAMDMTEGPILKKMLMFSLPLMASGILQLLFNATDVVVLGRFVSEEAMGAAGSTSSLINVLVTLFIGLSVGVNVVSARAHGGDSKHDVSEIVHTAMTLSLISGCVIMVIGIFLAPKVLILMNATETLLPLSTKYLRIYFITMPCNMIYNFGAAILRSIGDTRRPLYFLFSAGVMNLLMNLLFVVAFGMGIEGVAWATVISQAVSATLVVICLMKDNSGVRLYPKKLHINKRVVLDIVRVGLPAGFQSMLFAFSNVVLQSSVNLFGDTIIAGNTASQTIERFVYQAMNSFAQAAISFTGQNMGAKRYDRVPKILVCSLACVTVTGLIFGWSAYLCGRPLLGIISDKPEVIEAGLVRMSLICTVYSLNGMMDVMVGMLRGLGYSVMPMIVSLCGGCGLRLLWIATVFQIPAFHNIRTVYLSYSITWSITLIVHIFCYSVIWNRIKKKTVLEKEAELNDN